MTRLFNIANLAMIAGAFSVSGCSTSTYGPRSDSSASAPRVATLIAGDGSARGIVTLREDGNGATLTVRATGLSAGPHGIHLHEKGVCEGPAFTTAGGHWNPAAKKHGRENPAGAHLGDLPNLDVGGSGKAVTTLTVPSAATMADMDGTALLIHAKPDDYRTDPSGNSGDRIACAIIAPPR